MSRRRKKKFEKSMVSLTFCAIFCVFISIFFVKARLSCVNIEVEKLKKNISKQEKINESLTMKVNELKSLANIDIIAENEGLSYNSDNIIVITN